MPVSDGAPEPGADVVLLVTRMNIGGPARQVLPLAKGLTPELRTLLAAGQPSEAEGELVDPEVPVHRVPLVRPVKPGTDAKCLWLVRRLLLERRARLVHTHMAKAGTIGRLAASSIGTGRRPRTVHTFHGHVLQGYFGGPQQRAFLEMEKFLARHTDVLIAVSPEVRDELVDLGVAKASRFRVVPLGFDLAPLLAVGTPGGPRGQLRATIGLAPDIPLVGTASRLVPIKDHATLFRAMVSVPGAHLAVLGDGELRAPLERMAHGIGLGERAHFLGWWHDMPTALTDLDVVVLSSRNEGTPVALVEALAAGRPVVATDVGGVRHVVQDGETGWLASPGDSATLGQLVQRCLDEPGLAGAMAAEGRRRVAERFGHERMIADHLAIYRQLMRPA